MLKFFRKIRQKLLEQNRISKYLLYAFGEIILVVIGILIALQINNWNEKQIQNKVEIETLRQLKEEFSANLNQLDEKISMRKSMIKAGKMLLNYHDEPSLIIEDSVAIYIARTTVSPTFDPITNDLISAGRLYLISNLELRKILSKWPSNLAQVTEEEVAWIHINRNDYMPFLYENYQVRNMNSAKWSNLDVVQKLLLDKNNSTANIIGTSKEYFDNKKFLADPKLANLLSTIISNSNFTKIQSESLRKDIVIILELIDKELKVTQ